MKEGVGVKGTAAVFRTAASGEFPEGNRTFIKNLYQCSSGVYGGPA